MRYLYSAPVLAGAILFAGFMRPAQAHVVAGARVFPVTLNFDDPGVGDEISIPSINYSRSGSDGGTGPGHEVDLGFEFDKTITEDTALIFNDGYDIQQMNGSKTQTGFENLVVTGKWQAYTNPDHEFVVSLGIQRELGGSGTIHTGADHYGSTAPTFYFGKGLGDMPIGTFRPLAVTGELSYTIADKAFKGYKVYDPDSGMISTQFNTGNNNSWNGGVSLQYSLPYLQSQVRDMHLGALFGNLIPLVEFTWSSPATGPGAGPGQQPTTWTAAPGVIYLDGPLELGVEALVPLDKAAGTNVGAVALVHLFFDDMFPDSLGKPLF
jgi:hypothetical protein